MIFRLVRILCAVLLAGVIGPCTADIAAAAPLHHFRSHQRKSLLKVAGRDVAARWCGLWSGEVRGLRVRDLDLDAGVVHVRQAVVRLRGQLLIAHSRETQASDQ